MTYGTQADIRLKIRKLTGSGDPYQLTDSAIDDYVDSFYLFDFPAQFRSLKLKDDYVFYTLKGKDTYAFDSERYTTVQMPCKVEKNLVQLYQDPSSFYGYWGFNNGSGSQFYETLDTGTGVAGPYGGTATKAPMISSFNTDPVANPNKISIVPNILITANTASSTVNVYDIPNDPWDGTGVLAGDVANALGTINYQTGVVGTLTFSQTIPSGNEIQIQYIPVVLNMPQGILFFQNQFTLRPVPDKGYTVELVAYRRPSQALENAGQFYPELTEWWETLAYGAAKKIYEDRFDMDGVAMMEKGLKQRYDHNYTRTYAQIGTQRCSTIFAPQNGGTGNYLSGFGGNL